MKRFRYCRILPVLALGLCAGRVAAESVTFTPTKDTDIYSFLGRPTGSIYDLGVSNTPTGSTTTHSQRALIQFNISSLAIPAGEIGTAVLRLYSVTPDSEEGGGYRPGVVNIFRQGAAWNAITATYPTWATVQPAGDPAGVLTMGEGMVNQWVDVDVTALVKAWAAGSVPNYGFVVQCANDPSDTTTNVLFGSMEFGDATKAAGRPEDQQPYPKLVITRATAPVEPPVLAIAAGTTPGEVHLQWPVTGSEGWVLETAADLNGPWTASSATATSQDGLWQVNFTPLATETIGFFRLRK